MHSKQFRRLNADSIFPQRGFDCVFPGCVLHHHSSGSVVQLCRAVSRPGQAICCPVYGLSRQGMPELLRLKPSTLSPTVTLLSAAASQARHMLTDSDTILALMMMMMCFASYGDISLMSIIYKVKGRSEEDL